MKNYVLLLILSLFSLSAGSQTHDPTVVRFVNRGKMHVAPNPKGAAVTTLYIPDGVLVDSVSSIVQEGVTSVGGNFYQNALSKAFKLRADSFTIGKGTVRFITNSLPAKQRKIGLWTGGASATSVSARYTASDPTAGNFFPRSQSYVAFPNIEIATIDTIRVAAVMGMDAIDIKRTTAANAKGTLYMESDPVGTEQIFDPSLRVTGNTVTAGAVVIEKYVLPFREATQGAGNKHLYPFATPYTKGSANGNQRAGYFAGNWVRAPRADAAGHYAYPYANKKSTTKDYIDESQYVRWAPDTLSAGAPYLIRLQPDGYDYDLPFVITGGEEHDLEKFVFNGTPYNLPHVEEQKFTGNLFSRTPAVANTKYQWLVGNSYTSAISIDSLIVAIQKSPIQFSNLLYVYPHGATTYDVYNLTSDTNIPDIPAMSVFMLIVASNNTNTSQAFTITPTMQVHGKGFYDDGTGPEFAPAQPNTQLTFRLTPEDNPYIYDQMRMVLQAGALTGSDLLDIDKPLNLSTDYFQIYGGSQDRALAKNALPETIAETALLVNPPKYALSCYLTVSGLETLNTETLLLLDTKLNVWTNLLETEEYIFQSEPDDSPERFTVYFKSPNGIDQVQTESVYAYCQDDYLYLNRLAEIDKGSKLSIYNSSGILLHQSEIDNYPHYSTAVNIPQGVFVAKIEGERNVAIKFIKR